jgi:hypothetical protein
MSGNTPTDPVPPETNKVEPKVWWATVGAWIAGVVGLAIVNAVTDDNNALLIRALPDWLEPFVLPLVPAVVAFIAGFAAKHQWRTSAASPRGGRVVG